MDILHLIDRLEQSLNDSQRILLTNKVVVDEDRVYNIVDQMRVAIPEAVKQANRVQAEKDRIIAQAHEEADRIRELAKQEAEELVQRDVITVAAQKRADNILERARHDADDLRQDADAYTVNVLTKLEEDLLRSLSMIRNGLIRLTEQNQPVTEADRATVKDVA